jgi:hypothetical protein
MWVSGLLEIALHRVEMLGGNRMGLSGNRPYETLNRPGFVGGPNG